jgi:hypothetical protein
LNYSIDFQSTCVYTFDNSTLKAGSCSDMAFPRLVFLFLRLSVDLIDKTTNDKHQIYSSSDAALKSILSKYIYLYEMNELFGYSLGITSEQNHPLETEKQIHPCDDYCEKV